MGNVLLVVFGVIVLFIVWRFFSVRLKTGKCMVLLEQRRGIIDGAKELVEMSEGLLKGGMTADKVSELFLQQLLEAHVLLCSLFEAEQYLYSCGDKRINMPETTEVGESVVALVKKIRNE